MDPVKTKTRIIKRKYVLKDGTVKEYICKTTYKVKGKIAEDGTVNKFSNEEKAEIKRLHSSGVTITRLAKDYNASATTIGKVLNDK